MDQRFRSTELEAAKLAIAEDDTQTFLKSVGYRAMSAPGLGAVLTNWVAVASGRRRKFALLGASCVDHHASEQT